MEYRGRREAASTGGGEQEGRGPQERRERRGKKNKSDDVDSTSDSRGYMSFMVSWDYKCHIN